MRRFFVHGLAGLALAAILTPASAALAQRESTAAPDPYEKAMELAARIDAYAAFCKEDARLAPQIADMAKVHGIAAGQLAALNAVKDREQAQETKRLAETGADCKNTDTLYERYILLGQLNDAMAAFPPREKRTDADAPGAETGNAKP